MTTKSMMTKSELSNNNNEESNNSENQDFKDIVIDDVKSKEDLEMNQLANGQLEKSLDKEQSTQSNGPVNHRFNKFVKFIPLIVPILSTLTFIMVYINALINENVEPIFPYISDAATNPPQAAYFGQTLTIDAIILAVMMFCRWKQIKYVYEDNNNHQENNHNNSSSLDSETVKLILKLNKYSLIAAVAGACGLSFVGNFRAIELVVPHGIGAATFFTSMFLLILFQAWLSFLMVPHLNTKIMAFIRAIITFLAFVFTSMTIISAFISGAQFDKNILNEDRLKWSSKDQGYIAHVISSIGEWLTIIMLLASWSTFYVEAGLIYFVNGDIKFNLLNPLSTPSKPILLSIVGPKGFGRIILKLP